MSTNILAETVEEIATRRAQEKRAAFIQGLRDCAAFFEQHPAVQTPVCVDINVFVNTREALAVHARVPGGWEKIWNGEWFYLRKTFAPDFALDITAGRETVCRKVVKGTRIVEAQPAREVEDVEWVCDEVSLLAGQS